jgi:hypothetical protein
LDVYIAILCACVSLNRSSILTLFCVCCITCTNLLHTVAASFSCGGTYVPGIEDHVGTTGRTEVASTACKRVWMGLQWVAIFPIFYVECTVLKVSTQMSTPNTERNEGFVPVVHLRCIFRGIFRGYRAIFI